MKKIIIISIIIIFIICVVYIFKNNKKNDLLIVKNEIVVLEEDAQLNIIDEKDIEKLKKYKLPMIICFGADFCPPCNEMQPILQKLNNEFINKAIIKFVDVKKYNNLTEKYDIKSIPTQIFINSDGTPYYSDNIKSIGFEYVNDENGILSYTYHDGILTEEELKNILYDMGVN